MCAKVASYTAAPSEYAANLHKQLEADSKQEEADYSVEEDGSEMRTNEFLDDDTTSVCFDAEAPLCRLAILLKPCNYYSVANIQ
jgi:hypothetical protein